MDYSQYISNSQNALNNAAVATDASKGALDQYSGGMKGASDLYSGAEQQYGVQGAKDAATQSKQALGLTQGLINNLPNSVTGRTQGSLVTEAQRQKLLQNEMTPLNNQYNIQGQNYNDQTSNLQSLMAQAAQKSGLDYQSQQDKYKQLFDMYNTNLGTKNQSQADLNQYLGLQSQAQQLAAQQKQWQAEQALRQQQLAQTIADSNRNYGLQVSANQASQAAQAAAQQQQVQQAAIQAQAKKQADQIAAQKASDQAAAAQREAQNNYKLVNTGNWFKDFANSVFGGYTG